MTDMKQATGSTGLTRLSRRWLVVLLAVTAVTSAGVGILAGNFLDQSEIIRPENSMAEIPVYAVVENRIVDDRLTFSGVVKAGPAKLLQIDGSGQEPVLVRQTLQIGEILKWGDLAGVISGKPYFVVPGPLPLYRDLAAGDHGDDVLALQRAFMQMGYQSGESGRVDLATMRAAASFFASEGFLLSSGRTASENGTQSESDSQIGNGASPKSGATAESIPFKQLLVLPVAEASVVAALEVGQKVTAESPLAKFQVSDNYVEFIAERDTAETLKAGQDVTVRVATKQMTGRIIEVGPFNDAGNGQRAGHPVRVEPTTRSDLDLWTPNLSVTVSGKGSASEALAIPLSAIRQDGGGTYVLRSLGDDSDTKISSTTRVSITVTRSGGGFAAVAGDLVQGDKVQIS